MQHKNLWSDVLNRHISINVTTAALRQIDRAGGLDNYLLNSDDKLIASDAGLRLKRQLQQARRALVSSSGAANVPSAAATKSTIETDAATTAPELR